MGKHHYKCNDVKFYPRASTDLISLSKLTAICFKISFGDEEAVVIRRRLTNEICCTGVEINQFYWITMESFLDLVHRDGSSKEEETSR